MTPETLAQFKEKITTMHHDLLDLLNGTDVIFEELMELEDMADANLGTHLIEEAEKMAHGTDEELNK